MHRALRRTGAVLAWLLLASCRVYDADLLAPSSAHEAASSNVACQEQNVELCNGVDDDCDAIIDEGASDTCSSQHAHERCAASACEIVACDYGFVDCDGDADDGCEQLITRAGCAPAAPTGSDVVSVGDADAGEP
jgi:hypothetical protein